MTVDLDLELQVASEASNLPEKDDVALWAHKAISSSKQMMNRELPMELSVRIVDEVESRELNSRYRQIDKPTNVLSFPYESPKEIPINLLGDLVICAPVVVREAKQQYKATQAHWAHMVIHGVLHLMGYDHEENEQALEMEALEVQILEQLGFADPYADNNPAQETHPSS